MGSAGTLAGHMKFLMKLWVYAAAVPAFVRTVREGRPIEEESPAAGAFEPKSFFKQFREEAKKDQLSVIAGSLAYYALLSLIPTLIALVSIYGLVFDAADVERQISDLADVLPDEAEDLVLVQLENVVQSNTAGLGIGVVVSIIAALWSASSGVKALIAATNLVFDEEETRSFLVVRGLSLAFMAGAVVVAAVGIGGMVVLPRVLPLGGIAETLVSLAIWPAVVVVVALVLSLLYHFGPAHTHPKWEWASLGATGAAVAWAVLTLVFSFYVKTFGSFSATYGALAGVIILLLWFYLSGFVVLLGAEANAVLAHRRRTTAATV